MTKNQKINSSKKRKNYFAAELETATEDPATEEAATEDAPVEEPATEDTASLEPATEDAASELEEAEVFLLQPTKAKAAAIAANKASLRILFSFYGMRRNNTIIQVHVKTFFGLIVIFLYV